MSAEHFLTRQFIDGADAEGLRRVLQELAGKDGLRITGWEHEGPPLPRIIPGPSYIEPPRTRRRKWFP